MNNYILLLLLMIMVPIDLAIISIAFDIASIRKEIGRLAHDALALLKAQQPSNRA